MANFRSGYLTRGTPLGQRTKTVVLRADNQVVDPKGFLALKILGKEAELLQSGTATGGGPYTVTVTTVGHGLTSGDTIKTYSADTWTDPAAVEFESVAVTVLTDDTFSFDTTEDPGASGTLSWKLTPAMRTFTLGPGDMVGHVLHVYLGNDAQAELISGGDTALTANWDVTGKYDSLSLMWQDNKWIESSRGLLSQGIDAQIDDPQDADLLVYDSGESEFRNQPLSGDATIDNNGALTVSEGIQGVVEGTLSSAQLISLNSTPVQLVPDGTGTELVIVEQIEFLKAAGAVAYAGGGDLQIQYTDPSNTSVATVPAELLNTGNQVERFVMRPTIYDARTGETASPWNGFLIAAGGAIGLLTAGIRITNDASDFTGGDVTNTLQYRITFRRFLALN